MHAKTFQSCLTLCNPMDCSPSGSSVHGVLKTRILESLLCAPSGDLPDPGIKPASLMPPALGEPYAVLLRLSWPPFLRQAPNYVFPSWDLGLRHFLGCEVGGPLSQEASQGQQPRDFQLSLSVLLFISFPPSLASFLSHLSILLLTFKTQFLANASMKHNFWKM